MAAEPAVIWRLLPLTGVTLLIAIAGVWRPWLQHRRYGTWGIVLFRSGSWGQFVRDCLVVVLFALLLWQAIAATGWAPTVAARPGGPELLTALGRPFGATLLFAGLVLLVAAQLNLGASWRIGIDQSATPGLVTGGLYRFCRNPIYLALLMFIAGYALLLPTRLSVFSLVGACIGICLQTRAEETHLEQAYGAAYRDYARRVGRFVTGIGRLR